MVKYLRIIDDKHEGSHENMTTILMNSVKHQPRYQHQVSMKAFAVDATILSANQVLNVRRQRLMSSRSAEKAFRPKRK